MPRLNALPGQAFRTGRTYTCSAYGLSLRSAVPLPAAAPDGGGAALVHVHRARLGRVTAELQAASRNAWAGAGEARLRIPGAGTFLVRGGREILFDPDRDADDVLLQLAILGPALAALLQQRGCLVLHASAVGRAGGAAGFVGACGAGKSTMAAALHERGWTLLADDILAVRLEGGAPRVLPGVPQLKLWPDAVTALGGDPDLLPRVDPRYEKRVRATSADAPARSELPLTRLYILGRGDVPGIEPLAPPEAFLQLVAHAYGAPWLHASAGADGFRRRAELVRRVPIRRLRRPPDLRFAPRLARFVEEDFDGG